jgi:hypothetical protein
MNNEPPLGSHLISWRNGYQHHGIFVGQGRVIHYAGWSDNRETGPVEETDLEAFSQGKPYTIAIHKSPDRPEKIIERARSRLKESAYSVFANNCEHFCNWCVTGDHLSRQVDVVTGTIAMSLATAAGLAARTAVAVSGPVYGLSGAGVMGGLAGIGGLISGGAVAGLAMLGAAPAIAMASLVNSTVLADPKNGDAEEKKVRQAGRAASYAGALAGTAGSVAAVSGMGAVAGLSGAGITSGLAAIGGLIGCGMGAGVAIATTAPVIAAAAVGYTTYKAGKAILRQSGRAKPSSSQPTI